jgi:hypothetical protein
MPEEKVVSLAAFRVIQGSKPAPEAEPEEPDSDTEPNDVLETLADATERGADWSEVLIIFKDRNGNIDTCYSTMFDASRRRLLHEAAFLESESAHE